jgi:hypothetical protein
VQQRRLTDPKNIIWEKISPSFIKMNETNERGRQEREVPILLLA